MNLAGITDIARLLGVSKQRASQLAAREGFPKPLGKASGKSVWRMADVERWAKNNRRIT